MLGTVVTLTGQGRQGILPRESVFWSKQTKNLFGVMKEIDGSRLTLERQSSFLCRTKFSKLPAFTWQSLIIDRLVSSRLTLPPPHRK